MFDDILDPIINFFVAIYRADKRPEARKLTIGCFVIVMIVVTVIAVIYSVSS